MHRLRRATRILLDLFCFGGALLLVLILFFAVFFSAYSSYRVMASIDLLTDDVIRAVARLDNTATRLDAHAEFLVRKSSQIERKLPSGGTRGKGG